MTASRLESGENAAAVATAIASRAGELFEQGRFEAVLVLCGELVERFGLPLSSALRAEVTSAAAIVGSVQVDAADAQSVASPQTERPDDVADEPADVVVSRKVAWAILEIALALDRLNRHDVELEAYDDLIERFSNSTDQNILGYVGWALWDKSRTLDQAGRRADALAVCRQLIDRHDETADESLADVVSWCMEQVADGLRDAGQSEQELRANDDLIGRFGESTDDNVRGRVVYALSRKAYVLGRLNRVDDELAAYDEMVNWYYRSLQPLGVRKVFIDSLRRKATTLEDLGRAREAMVVYDSVVAAYLEESSETSSELLPSAVLSLLRKVECLCTIDPGSSVVVVRQMADLLPDAYESRHDQHDDQEPLSEEGIAGLLVALCSEGTWMQFATSGDDETSRAAMAQRALELYQMTRVWLTGPAADLNTPATGAAMLIRNIADGYALLSRSWRGAARESVSLPSNLLIESLIRNFEIDEWAADLGHPLELSDSEELADELMEDERENAEQTEVDLAAHFVVSIRQHEMLEILCDSPSGQVALQTEALRNYAVARINRARKIAGWTSHQAEDAAGAAATGIVVAEGLFVATNTTTGSSAELFPNRTFLRSLLRESETYDWLDGEDVELPGWLEQQSSD